MKKTFQFTAPAFAAVTVLSLTALTVFAAGPTAIPTGGNVDANFNSLSIGPLGSETLLLNSAGELSTKAGDFNPVMVNDTYGLRLESTMKGFESVCTTCTPGFFSTDSNLAVSATANGASGIGGDFTGKSQGIFAHGTGAGSTGMAGAGDLKGVVGTATAGTGGEFTGTTYGVQGTATAMGSTGAKFTGNLIGVSGTGNAAGGAGVSGSSSGSNGKGVSGNATGDMGVGVSGYVSGAGATTSKGVAGQVNVGAPASAVAGSFINQVSGNTVLLGTNSNAVEAAGSSDLKGVIRNTSLAAGGEVRVQDSNGFSVADNAGASGVGMKTLLGNYSASTDFTNSFMFGPFVMPNMLTDFGATGGLATNGVLYSAGLLVKDPNSGLSIDSENGGMTITTQNGGETIYSTGGGGLTINSNTGGLTMSKNDGTFLGTTTATMDSATGSLLTSGNVLATDGTNASVIYNNGWIAAFGGAIYTAATDWSNFVALWPNGNIDATGKITAKDLQINGHIRSKTLGFWYTSTSSTNEIAKGGGLYAAQVSCFPGTGSYATGCGTYLTDSLGNWSANGTGAKTVLYSLGRSPGSDTTCQATYINNDAALKQYFKLEAYCFTPDS